MTNPTRDDSKQRPDDRRGWWRSLDLKHAGKTFLRRRGIDLGAFGLYLHRIDAPDPGLDVHDYPWPFVTLILRGGYSEDAIDTRAAVDRSLNVDLLEQRERFARGSLARGARRSWRAGSVHRMPLTIAHRITSTKPGTVSLVLRGRKSRPWGFYTPTGWVQWTDYDYATRRPLEVISTHPEEHCPPGSTIPGAAPC